MHERYVTFKVYATSILYIQVFIVCLNPGINTLNLTILCSNKIFCENIW